MKQSTYDKLEIILNILILLFIILAIILVLCWLGNQAWAMQQLHNQCIAECVEINKKASELICVC
jgi:uncharacterized membrane protein